MPILYPASNRFKYARSASDFRARRYAIQNPDVPPDEFSPSLLFAAMEQGAWYDPSDLTTLYQDATGTTPVTAVEQPVGLMLDKSGRGNHAFQTTATSRPVLSARVNLLTKTEQFDDGVWTKSGATVAANTTATLDPLGGNTADKLIETAATAAHYVTTAIGFSTTQVVSYSVYAKAAERSYIILASNNNNYGAQFNLSSGVVVSANNPPGYSASIQSAGNGWYLCTAYYSGTSGQTPNFAFMVSNGAATNNVGLPPSGTSYTGDGYSGVYIWGASLVPANQSSLPYQRVNTATDYDSDPTKFPRFLRCDGIDDGMVTGTITPGTDKAQVFAGIRKLSDAAVGVIAEYSATANSNIGSFNLFAPDSRAAASYSAGIRGSATISAYRMTSYPAPISSVASVSFDIAGSGVAAEIIPRINGTTPTLTSIGGADSGSGNFNPYPLYLFRRGGTSLPFNGHFYGGIIRFGPNLPIETIEQTEAWMAAKTGVTL